MVKKAKNYLNGVVALRTENIHNLALKYGEMFMLRQEIIPPKKYLEKINQVDLKEVKNLFEKLITPERTRMAIIGPFKKEEKFVKILKESSR
jgi:predicted Zn-dependent peptidase